MKNFIIQNFEEFINEKNAKQKAKPFKRFYLFVDEVYHHINTELGKLISLRRNEMFEQLVINDVNFASLDIKPDIPIINFTSEFTIVNDLIEKKLIAKKNIYNLPDNSVLVSDKVKFHKLFGNEYDFIPKTVFSVDECKDLKFPIIAKPAEGKSAEGIQKFDTYEELNKSKSKFDLYSEAIKIKREFRSFCFKNDVIEIDERLKIKDSEDFLKNAKTKTDFYYKMISTSYDKIDDLKKILKDCKKLTNLDFYSIDFAEDESGKLYVIEMNSRTGMGVEKMTKLYECVYEDFYSKPVDNETKTFLNSAVQEWKKKYKEEKKLEINECTTVTGLIDNKVFLFKNRDRSFTPDTKVIHEKYKNTEIVFYTDQTGWIEGMNEYGIGFVFSQLSGKDIEGYDIKYTVSDEPKDDGKFKRFAESIKNILTAKTADDAIKKLLDSKKSGSFLIGDSKEIFEIEIFEGKIEKRKLEFSKNTFYTKTNHGILIPSAGHQPSGYSIKRASSEIRRHQADIQLQGVTNILDIPSKMKFQMYDTESSLNTFRTDREEYTISQCLMSLTNLEFYFYHDRATADSIKIESDVKTPKIKIKVFEI